jgi:hypothetical protein
MPFEHRSDPVIPRKAYLQRQVKYFFMASFFVVFSILLGTVGYHYSANLAWIDSLLNASMILTGMGPVDHMNTTSAKLFSSFYCMYSGLAFLTTAAVLFAPFIHRTLHKLNVEDSEN